MTGVQADVLIVGAGPVGLFIANMLVAGGLHAILAERNPGVCAHPRAITADAETLRILDRLDLLGAVRPGLVEDVGARFKSATGRTLMAVDAGLPQPYGFPAASTFYQPQLEVALLHGAKARGVDVKFQTLVKGLRDTRGGVRAQLVGPEGFPVNVDARFAVACDGASSSTRTALGIGFEGSTYVERWLVVDCAADPGFAPRDVSFFCDPGRPAVTLPMADGRRRWEFLVFPEEDANHLLDAARIDALVARYQGVPPTRIERKAVYTFHIRTADRWRDGNIFLAGDAAHVMPPFAGQGMNSGVRDAFNLAWRLAAVHRGQASPALLDGYMRERSSDIAARSALTARLGSIIMT